MKPRDNPFASRFVESLSFVLEGAAREDLMDSLRAMGRRGAIVGPEGSGKTTLLEELAQTLEAQGLKVLLLRLNREKHLPRLLFSRRFPADQIENNALLLDGAEQMPWWAWRLFCFRTRKAAALVVTSHTPGLLPTLLETRTTPELLRQLANSLLEQSPEPGARRVISMAEAHRLFAAHEGNLRLAFRELYDVWACRD